MEYFFSPRWRNFTTLGLVLALLLTTGVHVYVHAHPAGFASEASSLVAHRHLHVGDGAFAFDASADAASDPVDVSFNAVLKVFTLFPIVALPVGSLSLRLAGDTDIRARRLSSATTPYRDPPHLAPQGRGPPQ